MRGAADDGDFTRYISHDAVADAHIEKAARNRFLTDAMKPVHALVRRFWYSQIRSAEIREAMQLHSGVIQAAGEGDADTARDRLMAVYDQNERFFYSLLS